jgi:hypothetical protein
VSARLKSSYTTFYITLGLEIARLLPFTKKLRAYIEPLFLPKNTVVWRNYEISDRITSLQPILFPGRSSNILQEYFIPPAKLLDFVSLLRTIAQKHRINILNATLRYVPADTQSLMRYAPVNSLSLVLYINIPDSPKVDPKTRIWSQELIDAALSVGGTYYLPYQLYGSQDQSRAKAIGTAPRDKRLAADEGAPRGRRQRKLPSGASP